MKTIREQFGDDWQREMMKHPKAYLVQVYRTACMEIARRESQLTEQKPKEEACSVCGGDGKERCDNPDHAFISGIGGEISRLGCPVCGHDPDYIVKGGICEHCNGTGKQTDHSKESAEEFLESLPMPYSQYSLPKLLTMYTSKREAEIVEQLEMLFHIERGANSTDEKWRADIEQILTHLKNKQ